jgi:hypothetical protein
VINDCRLCHHYDLRLGVCLHTSRLEQTTFGRMAYTRDDLNPKGTCRLFKPDALHLTPKEQVSGWRRFFRRNK